MRDHINGYSLALLILAKEEKKIKKIKTESITIIEAVKENEAIINVLDSKGLDVKERQEIVKKSFNSVDIILMNTMFILVERSKFKLIIPILKKLIKFLNKELNTLEGIIYSTIKLTAKDVKSIENKVEKRINHKVSLINKIDAEMIAGIRVIINDEVIEDTAASRFEQIKNELLSERRGY